MGLIDDSLMPEGLLFSHSLSPYNISRTVAISRGGFEGRNDAEMYDGAGDGSRLAEASSSPYPPTASVRGRQYQNSVQKGLKATLPDGIQQQSDDGNIKEISKRG